MEQQKKAKNLVVITVETKILLVKEQKKAMDLATISFETIMLMVKEQKKAKNLALIFLEANASLMEELSKAMELADTTDTKDSTTTKAFLRASVNARAQDRQRVLPLPVVHHVSCVLSTKSLQEISNSSSHCSYSRLDSQQESTNFYKLTEFVMIIIPKRFFTYGKT